MPQTRQRLNILAAYVYEIMEVRTIGHYDLMYKKKKKIG